MAASQRPAGTNREDSAKLLADRREPLWGIKQPGSRVGAAGECRRNRASLLGHHGATGGGDADQIEIRLQGNEVIIAGMRQLPNLLRARRTEDLEEITPQAREGICFEFLTTVEDALRLALEPNSAAGFPASPRLAS